MVTERAQQHRALAARGRAPITLLVLGVLWLLPALARADSFDPISFGVHASSLGDGITLERPLLFDLSARVETGLISISSDHTYDGSLWKSTFNENNALVALDWRPYGGRWRVSGGVLLGGDHVDRIAQAVGPSYVLNGTAYPVTSAGIVSARTSFANPAMYLGFGGGTGILKGLTIGFDAGVVVRNGTLATNATGPLQASAQFESDLAATAAQFHTHFIQPVLTIGLVYRP